MQCFQCHQGISDDDIDWIIPEYFGLRTGRDNPTVSGAYPSAAVLFLRSDRSDDFINYVVSPVQHTAL